LPQIKQEADGKKRALSSKGKRSQSGGGSPKKNTMSSIKFENNYNKSPIDYADIFME